MADPAPKRIKIPQGSYSDIAEVVSHAPDLSRIVELSSNAELQLNPSAISRDISPQVGIPEASVAKILNALANFRMLMERFGLSPDSLVGLISENLATQATPKWKEQNLERWNASLPSVSAALATMTVEHPLIVIQKVRELTYSHEKVFLDASLYTDLRPVFNAKTDAISALVLTHILSINYQDGEEQKRIEFALDLDDVITLRKISERAQLKTSAAQKHLSKAVKVIVPGRNSDYAS